MQVCMYGTFYLQSSYSKFKSWYGMGGGEVVGWGKGYATPWSTLAFSMVCTCTCTCIVCLIPRPLLASSTCGKNVERGLGTRVCTCTYI